MTKLEIRKNNDLIAVTNHKHWYDAVDTGAEALTQDPDLFVSLIESTQVPYLQIHGRATRTPSPCILLDHGGV